LRLFPLLNLTGIDKVESSSTLAHCCVNTICYFNPTGHYGKVQSDLLIRLGTRVKALRARQGWTQVELAEKVGIDRSFLADVERGKRNISILNLAAIAEGLDVTLSQFFSRL